MSTPLAWRAAPAQEEAAVAPLRGVRVLELGNYIAAPAAGRLLADFGADVIKVERPRTGDELRTWRLHAGTTSMLYRTINRNKRSIVLDLRSERGREIALRLVAECDVVLENFRPGTLEAWGLGPQELERVRPGIILARISAYGQTGPLSSRPGFASGAEAHGGFRELVGDPDRPPVRVGVSIGDTIAGLYAAFGAVMALYERGRTHGVALADRVIDVALNEAMLSVTESLLPDFTGYGVLRQRTGGRMEGIAPSNAYVCRGGASIVVAGNGDGIFRRYMDVIGRPDLGADPGLASNEARWERRDELDAAIGAWASQLPAEEALARLARAGVPAGPIYTAADIVTDEQYGARGMVQRFDVSTGEQTLHDVAFPGVVPVIGQASLPIRHLGPDLGAHTREVLTSLLRMTDEEVDEVDGVDAAADLRRTREAVA